MCFDRGEWRLALTRLRLCCNPADRRKDNCCHAVHCAEKIVCTVCLCEGGKQFNEHAFGGDLRSAVPMAVSASSAKDNW